ncbi:hypothetical protein LJC27_01775 [Christensenellaceae bacterium OttesenSCG-928-M15]|nr:hypothetical protein [Christensenellaceae bacterium OttesenSCG-928-M15]
MICNGEGSSYNTVDAYNANLVRTTPTETTIGRIFNAAASTGKHALVGGGQATSGDGTIVDVYDKNLARKTPVALSVARSRISGTGLGTNAIFAGGQPYASNGGVVDVFNKRLIRSVLSLNTPRQAMSAGKIGKYALFAGGYGTSGYSTAVEALTIK